MTQDPPPPVPAGMDPALVMQLFQIWQRQLEVQEQTAASLQTQVERTAPRENPNYRPRSIYNPEGKPESERETLKCQIFFGPVPLNRTPLLPAEIAWLNRIGPLAQAQLKKVDNSVVLGSVEPTYDAEGHIAVLRIQFKMGKDDNPQHFPPLDQIAQQLATQYEARRDAAVAVPA
jgi:hypothetical protein